MSNVNKVISYEAGQGYNLGVQRLPKLNSRQSRMKLRAIPGEAMWRAGIQSDVCVCNYISNEIFNLQLVPSSFMYSSGLFWPCVWASILQCPEYPVHADVSIDFLLFDGTDIFLLVILSITCTSISLLTEYEKDKCAFWYIMRWSWDWMQPAALKGQSNTCEMYGLCSCM